MIRNYHSIRITEEQASRIAEKNYGMTGEIIPMPGDSDFNFRIKTETQSYMLKVSRPGADEAFIEYQVTLLDYLSKNGKSIISPAILQDQKGNMTSYFMDQDGNKRLVRMLSWIEGRLWSSVNPINEDLLYKLGQKTALLTKTLSDFDNEMAHRQFDWDIAQSGWIKKHLSVFEQDDAQLVKYFMGMFNDMWQNYQSLRKSVIHNDANDNNIIVTEDLVQPDVRAIIDFGDAIFTQTINELAIAIAYAVMGKTDVLAATLPVVSGFHSNFPLEEKELDLLYILVAMRLVISVSKSAISKQLEPENEYLRISEKPAWDLLGKWKEIDPDFAKYSFRQACGYLAHPNAKIFQKWAAAQTVSLRSLFPDYPFSGIHRVDMSLSGSWLGHRCEYEDQDHTAFKIAQLRKKNNNALIAGGYKEIRPFYSTEAFRKVSNEGPEYRTVHLGIDCWAPAQTAVHAPFDGTVFNIHNNDNDKDYGPTLILEHQPEAGIRFWTLYGHLTKTSLNLLEKGQLVEKDQLIAFVGHNSENGGWAPHLHFQIMLDMLGRTIDFPGVSTPNELAVWSTICPDPSLIFREKALFNVPETDTNELLQYRKSHLGKSLSLSYDKPLHILRGDGIYLIDDTGRRFMDTVNNVAHVGHEHPSVVDAGRQQMALLNTNTRYLHGQINRLTKELQKTLPDELSVVYFVNSGSEANELALRMAKTYTGEKDMIAVEMGYHGNTNACIDISSYKFDGKGGNGVPKHTHIVPLPDSFRGLYLGRDTGKKYAAHIGQQLEKIQSHGRNIAAFICESIISCGGQIELPKDYLRTAYNMIRKAGGLCIADEVQVGCGRIGSHFWGFELHGVIPDIVTIGKPIGNGHPLAAVVCTRKVAEAFANGMEYFNTFGGNPVSCAIGAAVLHVIKEEKLQENALTVGNYLKNALVELKQAYPIIGDVRGQGLFLGFELIDSDKGPMAQQANYLANRMRELGILMSTDGKDNNVIKIKPPLVFSIANANELIHSLHRVLEEDLMKNID